MEIPDDDLDASVEECLRLYFKPPHTEEVRADLRRHLLAERRCIEYETEQAEARERWLASLPPDPPPDPDAKMRAVYRGLTSGLAYEKVYLQEMAEDEKGKDAEYLAWLESDRSTPYPPEKPSRKRKRRR